jgi:hypothetical protein
MAASRPDTMLGHAHPLTPDGWGGSRLAIARAAWIFVTLLALGLAFLSIPQRFDALVTQADQRSLAGLGLSAETFAAYALALDLIVVLAHVGIAAVVFLRRSEQWMCLLVAFALSANGAIIPLSLAYSGSPPGSTGMLLSGVVIYFGLVSSVALLYIFPDGRFVPPWTRVLAGLWMALAFPAIFFPRSLVALTGWPLLAQLSVLLAWTGTGVFAQAYRYLHVASPVERQQAKWGFLGLTAAGLAPFAYFLPFVILPGLGGPRVPNILYQQVGAGFFAATLLAQMIGLAAFAIVRFLFPLSFAIAILRYRLWDIDVIIRRTLIYAALTAALAAVYLVSVVLFQVLFRVLTGQTSQLAVVASTLAIAALFGPLRRRVQDSIDRRFYRRKYDAARTLANFSEAARSETDLDRLVEQLLVVVEDTMQPTYTSLWLREPGRAEDSPARRNAPRNDLQTGRP